MKITMSVHGLEKVQQHIAKLSGPALREAQAKALNDAAFQVRRVMQAEIRSVFDRPTPFIANAPKVFAATPDKLEATIVPTIDSRNNWSKGGKIGVDPQQVLRAQEAGGTRRDKRSEVALRRVGILPTGYQTAIPADSYPGSDDGRGNLRGAFLQQLLSYFQAFGEQGYRANMTQRRKDKLHARGHAITESGISAATFGRRYFVSYGRLRGSPKSGHLAAGIWAASGTHDANVRPVLMFVRAVNYKPLLSMERIARAADVDNYLAKRLRYRIRQAAGV